VDLDEHPAIASAFAKLDRLLDRYVNSRPSQADMQTHQAFLWEGTTRRLRPVKRPVRLDPATLLGIEDHKERVMDNTRRFISGGRANNVLLWGERGTGKSSLFKSLLYAFSRSSLRMVEVLKHDILTVRDLYELVEETPACRFILFIDDLSFEKDQTDYKEMKTLMDGGLAQLPENLLFYATSNRKHLVPTLFSDRENDEIRPADTVEEKVSLADRFGIRLGFYHVSQETYLEIVDLYARQYNVRARAGDLHRAAVRWSLEAGSRNGRTAEQFVRSLAG